MDFIVKLPFQVDSDETLISNKILILTEWNLPDSYVTLCLKDELTNKETINLNIEKYFKRLVILIHSLYVSNLTEKDVYLALAYKKEDYLNINHKKKNQTDESNSIYEIYSEYSLQVPFYNPLIMIKTLLESKNIFKLEINSKDNLLKDKKFEFVDLEESYLFLLNECYKVLMITLENILKPSIQISNIDIDLSYFDEIINSFNDFNNNSLISINKIGIGIHSNEGRGLFSTEEIQADTNLIEISLSCTLSFFTALFSEEFGYIARYLSNPTHYLTQMKSIFSNLDVKDNKEEKMFQPIDHDSILLLFTIYQVYLGEKSKWSKVISLWPNFKDPINQNLYTAPKEVVDFLSHGGNDFNTRINDSVDELYSLLNHVHYLLNIIKDEAIHLSKKYNNQKLPNSILFFKDLDYLNIFTWKKFNEIKYILDTRSFSIKWWPLNDNVYPHFKLQDQNKLHLINQSLENDHNLELIYIPISDFNSEEKHTNFLIPVPTEGIRTIIPIADMFNHSYLAPCSSPSLDKHNNKLIIKNEIDLPKNTQIFIRYGILTTNECLYAYGFIPQTNPVKGLFDTLTLNLQPEDDDPLYKIKILLLKYSNIPTDHIFAKLSIKLTNIELLFKCIDVVTSDDPISVVKNWDKQVQKHKYVSNKNSSKILSEILENILKPCIKQYNLLIQYKSSPQNERPFWFNDWGERSIQYYSSQIELIKLSLEKFKKKKI